MTAQLRATLKAYFETGDKPSQTQFANTIDSFVSLLDTASQTITSPLVVSGAATFSSTVSAQSLTVLGATRLESTLAAVGAITASSDITVSGKATITGGIVGTTTNNNAAPGNVGEFLSATLLAASEITLTTGTPANVTFVPVSAGGDYEFFGTIGFDANAATTITNEIAGLNTTSATLTNLVDGSQTNAGNPGTGVFAIINVGPKRISTAVSANVYLVAQSTFGTNTMKAYGFISARRVR